MSFWNTTKPNKPTGIKKVGSTLPYPIKVSDWLTGEQAVYESHTITGLTNGLTLLSSSHASGIITVWLSGGTIDTIASFTLRIVTTTGSIETFTFYLKILP